MEFVLESLNGDTFTTNEAGEQENYRESERVLICEDIKGASDSQLFLEDEEKLDSKDYPAIVLSVKEITTFILDNFVHLRLNCGITADKISDASLAELCLLRLLGLQKPSHYHRPTQRGSPCEIQ